MAGGQVGGHEEQFARHGQMASTKFIKVNMSVDKRELFFLSPLAGLPILAKPVHIYGR
jgi:hypothetical protein